MKHFFYTYVLLSLADGMFYSGYTRDIHKIMHKYNSGNVPSYKNPSSWWLFYYEASLSLKDAVARKRHFKSEVGRRYIRDLLKTYILNDL